MPFPNHPEKYGSEPVVTPGAGEGRSNADGPEGIPGSVVLCYSRRLLDHVRETHDVTPVGDYYGDLYALEDTDRRVGVLGGFGIGAPTTAMLMADLAADGVERFLSVGFAGCLDDSIDTGEFVVPDGAIRDEGTSHHYVEPATYAHPSEGLRDRTETGLRDRAERDVHVGPTWTTDAVYRETVAEVERYADEGVLTVEMEAAAVFAVADHYGVEAAAAFVVSDHLSPSGWEPAFRDATEDLYRLSDAATGILAEAD